MIRKNLLNLILLKTAALLLFAGSTSYSQQTGSFLVGGEPGKYYPVKFEDGNWASNKPTELIIGRSNVHTDATYRGAVVASFTFHVSNWGNGADFIDANLHDYSVGVPMIGGWQDVTNSNSESKILIWLRGGNTTYYYSANATVNPAVYDGTQNSLPFQQTNGPSYGLKTAKDSYVLSSGYNSKAARLEYLDVFGDLKAKKVKVTQTGWPDYVFEKGHPLPTLAEVEQFIQKNKHLPGIPSAKEIKADGLDLGENQALLLEKIEELTLYIIEQNKKIEAMDKKINQLEEKSKK